MPSKNPTEVGIEIKIYPEKNIWGYQIKITGMRREDVRLVYTGFQNFEDAVIRVCERLLCYFLGKDCER